MKLAKHEQWRKGFPYYKVQYWDDMGKHWREIQKLYPTKALARARAKTRKEKTRLVIIYRDHREVL